MDVILSVLILVFGLASYGVGLAEVVKRKYRPNLFSRCVWLALAMISFAGVLGTGSSRSSVLLAGIFLAGNATICLASFWRGTRHVGKLEIACLILLLISAAIWIIFRAPLVSLVMSLFAHFIGGLPTYHNAWRDPSNESAGFWSLFFIASLFSIIAAWGEPLRSQIFAIYFVFFDGGMTVLSLRKGGS